MRRVMFGWIFCAGLFGLLAARATSAQETSTPEERARWVQITRRLEANPLDKDAIKDGEWAVKRVMEVRDVHVTLCADTMGYVENKKYKYNGNLLRQYLLGSAAFVVENPDKASDSTATNVAAMQSVLKIYAAIAQKEPKARLERMDMLLGIHGDEMLAAYVKKRCG
ncbi:MAG: hypothetical protein WAM91_08715 [Candidatus Acidiferrales bacterium]